MTYYIFKAGDQSLIGLDNPIIKAGERSDFISAITLLSEISSLHAAAETTIKEHYEIGYKEGMAKGYTDGQQQVAKLIQSIAERFEAICEERFGDIADAALAATKAIIGTFDDTELVKRLVIQALARIDNGGALTIEVAPAMQSKIAEHFAHLAHVKVKAVDELGALDCVFQTKTGKILAGLDLQISALSDRWGVAPIVQEPQLA